MPMTPEELLVHAYHYSKARAVVAERVSALEAEVQDAQRRKLPGIKSAVADAADAKARLEAAIEQQRDMFKSPRTITAHGIKFGLQKGKGKITWLGKPAAVVKLIKKHLAAKASLLIETKETLRKKALSALTGDELKKIGCTVGSTGDHVYVAAEDTAVDKLVERFLNEDLITHAWRALLGVDFTTIAERLGLTSQSSCRYAIRRVAARRQVDKRFAGDLERAMKAAHSALAKHEGIAA